MMAAFINKYPLHNGLIQIYNRDPVSAKGKTYGGEIWYAAIKLQEYGTNRSKSLLIRRSLKTADKKIAIERAEDLYQTLKYKHKKGISLKSKLFIEIAAQYLQTLQQQYDDNIDLPKIERIASPRTAELNIWLIENYIIPYFTIYNIEDITDLDIEEYVDYRKNYWKTGEGKEKLKQDQKYTQYGKDVTRKIDPSNRKPVKYNTINKDLSVIRAIFEYARKKRIIDSKNIPIIKNLKKPKNYVDKKPGLTYSEYMKIIGSLRSDIKTQSNPKHKRSKQLLYYYILILANTGMRVTEAHNVTFADTETKGTKDDLYMTIKVSGKGKSRTLIPRPKTIDHINNLEQFHEDNAKKFNWKFHNDKKLFINDHGKPVKSFQKALNTLFINLNLKEKDNQTRSAGTFRKYYITQQLIRGTNHYQLSDNVGNSVEVIQKYYSSLEPEMVREELTKMKKDKQNIDPEEIKQITEMLKKLSATL